MLISPIITSAYRLGSDTFNPPTYIDDVAEAYPSIDGAVATIMYGAFRLLYLLPISLITSEQTPIMMSQLLS